MEIQECDLAHGPGALAGPPHPGPEGGVLWVGLASQRFLGGDSSRAGPQKAKPQATNDTGPTTTNTGKPEL